MAKQIEGVYERILVCAKQEFLEKGYKDASLRIIAANAKTTTGSIYTRFGDKEGLFQAIVEPVAEELKRMFTEFQENFHQLDDETQKETMVDYSCRGMESMLDYMYDNFDAFFLLLDASYGTRFQHFVEELIDIEVDYTYKYMKVIGCDNIISGVITREFIHIVTTSYFESLFEVIRHKMSREDAGRYVKLLGNYHHAGFSTIFSLGKA